MGETLVCLLWSSKPFWRWFVKDNVVASSAGGTLSSAKTAGSLGMAVARVLAAYYAHHVRSLGTPFTGLETLNIYS